MNREEAINMLYGMRADNLNLDDAYTKDEYDALEMAIKALEQEPCDDCVKRQEVLDAITANCIWENEYNLTSSRIKKVVENLPSVASQPKTGRWIRTTDKAEHLVWECDKCSWQQRFNTNYCPNCGCAMKGSKR